jgi:glycosyltransferase involved in cell wall biosynthesis
LATVIKSLLRNPQSLDSLGLAGRQRMLTKFTWKRAAEQTVAVYRKVIGN